MTHLNLIIDGLAGITLYVIMRIMLKRNRKNGEVIGRYKGQLDVMERLTKAEIILKKDIEDNKELEAGICKAMDVIGKELQDLPKENLL